MLSLEMKRIFKISDFYSFIKFQKRFHASRKRILPGPEYTDTLPTFEYPVAKSSDRRVYAWGFAETGALGIHRKENTLKNKKRNEISECYFPMRITFAEMNKVTCITSGYGFSAFGIKSKDRYKVFGTGINSDSQIGYHDPRRGHPLEMLLLPAPIRLPLTSPQTTNILQLSAGRAHLVILTDGEGVFTLGNNAHGQCGRRVIENEDYRKAVTIHHIKKINNEKIVQIECGQDHSLFVTESGKVFACGWGSDGQLGNGNFLSSHNINQVRGDIEGEKIIKLSCAADTILALNDKGEVFGWGNTEYGQLNSENDQTLQCNTSKIIKKCNSFGKIIDIAAGGSHCLILDEYNNVFAWGFGILGKGPEAQQSKIPLKIPKILFGRNEFNPDSKVVKIFAGIKHSAAITSKGDLYMWGKNRYGCLGLGNSKDQFFPLRTAVGAEVLDVSCGVDHTIAFCKPFI